MAEQSATLKMRLWMKSSSGSYDVIQPVTSVSSVYSDDSGLGLNNILAGKANSNHTHTAADVGALPITGGTLTGNLRIKGTGNYGTKINLGDGDYVHFYEPTDDKLEIKANSINFVTTQTPGLTLNGVAIGGSSSTEKVCMAPPAPTYAEAGMSKIGICFHNTSANVIDYRSFTWNGSAWVDVNNDTISQQTYAVYNGGSYVGAIVFWWRASSYGV